MNSKVSVFKKLSSAALAILVAVSSIAGGYIAPVIVSADGGPIGDVIFNEPYVTPPPINDVSDVNWFKIDHPGYDMAYTQALSQTYNGVETTDHVVLRGDDISFYGYAIPPYADSVFTDLYEVNGVSFVLRPVIMNFHTFSEAGFLFNGEFYYVGAKMYYTGYALVLKCGNVAGMLEYSPAAANTASLCLYYIDNEEWNSGSYQPGNVTTTRTLVSVLKTGISNLDATPYRISLDVNSSTRAFDLYLDGAHRASVSATDVEGGATGPIGFGFYTGYYAHACSILTRIRFEDTKFDIDLDERPTGATVQFVDALSGAQIRPQETVNTGTSGQQYRVAQPRFINTGDPMFYYVLTSNSRGFDTENDMLLTYQGNPLRNTTTLYYSLRYEGDITDITEKKARVNGGEWENGDVLDPVLITIDDEIEYEVSVYTLPGGQSNPTGFGEIHDTIPEYLIIDKTSITGVESNDPIDGQITWKLEGVGDKTIVWTIPASLYPVSVSVKVKVDNAIEMMTTFINSALVTVGAGTMETNSTYHEYSNVKIIEEYHLYDEVDGPKDDKLPFPDLITYLRFNDTYTVKGLSESQAKMYIFKGYSYGFNGIKGFQPADSIDEIPAYMLEEGGGFTIMLFYMPVYVTIHFVDESGNTISTPFTSPISEMVAPFSDYYIKMSHYNSFISNDGKSWTYYDYELTAPPPVGTGRILGAEPVYPGSDPVFDGDVMDASKNITLYFTENLAAKVRFRELCNPGNILHDTKTYFFQGLFDPATAIRSAAGETLYDDIDLTSAYGKIYQYSDVFSLDGGAIQDGVPGVQTTSCEITLYFETTYTIIEKYHKDDAGDSGGDDDEDGDEAIKLRDDVLREIIGGESFNGTPPATIKVGDKVWKYIGYKVDNDSNPLNAGFPSISNLTGDLVIIYVYTLDTSKPETPHREEGKERPGGGSPGSPTHEIPKHDDKKPDKPDLPDDETPVSPFITDHFAYIIGYPDGNVRPESNVTRAETATVFFRLLTEAYRTAHWTHNNPYSDVKTSDWFNTAVSVMNHMEIIRGYPGGEFRPNGDITRAELATIAARFADEMNMTGNNSVNFSDIAGHWANADITKAASIGWVTGYPDGTFKPNQPITRAEFMTLVNRVLERVPETEADLLDSEMIHWPDNAVKSAWYYLAVQEATNSHEPEYKAKKVPGLDFNYERWIDMMENFDWLSLEID